MKWKYISTALCIGSLTSLAIEEEVEEKISDLLKNGIITECSSPWNSYAHTHSEEKRRYPTLCRLQKIE